MARVLTLLLVLAGPSFAQGALNDYYRLIDEARAVYVSEDRTLSQGARIDKSYEILAKAAQMMPIRWEAFMERGFNRCRAVLYARGVVQEQLVYARARGSTPEQLKRVEVEGQRFIDARLGEAFRNFKIMERRQWELKEKDPTMVDFASAAIKFANREYLEARAGASGAIDDFKRLYERGFRKDQCAESIALCYMDIAYQAFEKEEYETAQKHWDNALKWVRSPRLREIIRTNKAGAFELDNEYGRAEKILRRLIKEEPYRPGHHKNLGLILGYQNKIRQALYHYRLSRERAKGDLGYLHGNSWLRAGVIHAKLLEEDGDLLLAWKLLAEYRVMFGDDYNFCLWFGEICSHFGEYDTARVFWERARKLQPHCPAPYQNLVQIARRGKGKREDIEARAKREKELYEEAQARYNSRHENPAVKRVCGGLRDIGDVGGSSFRREFLSPDPLADYAPDKPPPWIVAAAKKRKPFVPWTPPSEDGDEESKPAFLSADGTYWGIPPLWIGVGIAVLVLLGAFLVFRRPAAAA